GGDNLGGGNPHSLSQTESIRLLAVNRELLAWGDPELLAGSVFQSQGDRAGRHHLRHGSRNGLHGFDCLRRGSRGDGALQLHAWLEVVDRELLSINRNLHAVRHVGKVPYLAILHLYYQVVAGDIDDLTAFHLGLYGWLALGFGCFRFNLGAHDRRKEQAEKTHFKLTIEFWKLHFGDLLDWLGC